MGDRKSGGPAAKVLALGVAACLVGATCAGATASGARSTAPSPAPSRTVSATPGCSVGAAWNAYAEEVIERWEEPALEDPIYAAGGTYALEDAKSSVEYQASNIDRFVANGAKVIVVRATDPVAIRPAVEKAADAGVAVIVFEYLVDSPRALIVAFDPIEIGRMEARAILAARPKGNYVIIKGEPAGQFEPDLIAAGIHEVLQPAIDRGDVKIVAETYNSVLDPITARGKMQSILAKNQNRIDAVITQNDYVAGDVITALKEAGLDGKVAVAGVGGDAWNLKQLALGTQTVDVWADLRLLGKAAGEAAVALCKNPDPAALAGAKPFTLTNGDQVTSILLTPQTITKDNLDVAIDSGWTTKADVCADVDAAKAPPACG